MKKIDEIDEKILRELERDGRVSNTELAERINLSASACLRRVQELERAGIIQGYRAVLNRAALGSGFIVYVAVGLSQHTKEPQKSFEKLMSRSPEVRECHNMAGSFEYLLRVEVADLAAYKNFHMEVLGLAPQVNSITSYMVMETTKDERA